MHTQIDTEHERLVALINRFLNCLEVGDEEGCSEYITEITGALLIPLENEEKVMEKSGYIQIDEHKGRHQEAIRQYTTMVENAEHNGYGNRFANDLPALFANNIVKIDMDSREHLQGVSRHP